MLKGYHNCLNKLGNIIPELEEFLYRYQSKVVLAGGAPRDMLYGVEIKDFDLFVLGGYFNNICDKFELYFYSCIEKKETFDKYQGGQMPVLKVVKYHLVGGIIFDVIQQQGDPENILDVLLNFDLNINQCYYDVRKKIVISLTTSHIIVNASKNTVERGRVNRLMKKYPTFDWGNVIMHIEDDEDDEDDLFN